MTIIKSTQHPAANSARHWLHLICPLTDSEAEFGIASIPISSEYAETPNAQSHSAWGEWYLAVQRGSENLALGVDLINNLMTARKIVDRAMSGAGLPVVEAFYDDYGDAICPWTDKTFNSLRRLLFASARSRTTFGNYRKVARFLSGPLDAIVSNPALDERAIEMLLERAFRKIDESWNP